MRRKKKSGKKKSAYPTPSLSASDESRLNSILQDSIAGDPHEIIAGIPDSRFARVLVERLCLFNEPPIPLLSAIYENFKDKQVRKGIKRALFKLEKRGIAIDEFRDPEGSAPPLILKPIELEKPLAYIGPVFGTFGYRAVVIVFHKSVHDRHMGVGFVSDKDGIQEFLCGPFGKKSAKEMKEDISENVGPLIETSLNHAATVLENAYQKHLELHANAAPEYLEFRPWLMENASLLERPIIYDMMSEDEIREEILTDSKLEKLFRHKLMESWIIELEPLRPFMEELLQVEDSLIVLTEEQKLVRAGRIKEKCLDELFPDSERVLFRRSLEEMAYVFFKLEEKAYCKLCLDAAGAILEKEGLLKKDTVMGFFLENSINYYMGLMDREAPRDKESKDIPSSNIIIP
ncbi:MAG: hypothetical protein GY864_01445 [Desulfobacterales bacterium]|nr:hypothetical protein [Desulfobacterales bacterium]